MKKVLVLGSSGMAGHLIALYLSENGYDVTGLSRKKNPVFKNPALKSPAFGEIAADAADTQKLKDITESGGYDYIINCIGVLNQFAENDPANAVLINSYLPHFLAKCTRDLDTRIIQMSTDCVFSGKKGAYKDTDMPDGESFYDRTKALGELRDTKNVTLRCSIVGPDINESGIGLLNWFMKQHGEINGYTGAVWTGQTTLQLAKTMDFVMQNGISGLYNAVPEKSITKFELLSLFNKSLRQNELKINPVEGVKLDKSLIPTNFPNGYKIPGYEQMVSEAAQWIFEHKAIYSHYGL